MVIAISAFRSFLIMLINQFPVCNKFRKWGVLCGYVLKVLDVMDIKLFLEKYIIRRWTQQTRSNVVQDVSGRIIIENLKLNANRRYYVLFRTLLKIAASLLYKQVEEKIKNLFLASGYGVVPPHTASKVDNLMENSAQCSLTLKKRSARGRVESVVLVGWREMSKNKT
jgi:hypothetical protein